MIDAMLANGILASLYQSSITESPQTFQRAVLKHLDGVIGFDRAWWGIMSLEQSGLALHSSFRYELPMEFEEHWQHVKDDDTLAFDAHAKPRTTIHFNEKSLRSTSGLAELNTCHDLRHALCTSIFLPDQTSFLFISLFRSGAGARPFSQEDVHLKELLTPHLFACWRTNMMAHVELAQRSQGTSDSATAFIDRRGQIIYADGMFGELISSKWPSWKGRQLPDQILNILEGGPARNTDNFLINQHAAGGLRRIQIRHPSLIDRLSPREREVASHFSQASSYKEIATKLGISPATVRHYLRLIYLKLKINDKSELVKIMNSMENAFDNSSMDITQASSIRTHHMDYLGHAF